MAKLMQEELDRIKDRTFNLAVKGIRFTVDDIDLVTINGMPLKEFLEGVAWLGESSYRLQTLITLAHKYGVELTDETDLFRCDHELTKAIEPRIMPPGMTWPRFEDGELVKVGDEFERNGKTVRIVGIHHAASSCYLNEAAGGQYYYDAPLKRPEPKQETLQDVIDDLYKQVPNQEFGHIIRVPIDLIGRLKAIQERMGGEGESKADSPVEIPERKTCPLCGRSHVITTKVITIGEGRYSEAETDLCLTCGRDLVGEQ